HSRLISWFPLHCWHGRQTDDRTGVLRAHRAGRWPAAWVRHRGRGCRAIAGPGPAQDRQLVRSAGPAGRGRADRAGPGGSTRRPATPLLPAYGGRAASAGCGGRASCRVSSRGAGETWPDRYAGSRMSGNLERRYRRVLRLLPRWYREQWEEDMVAAFLDSWLTGDPEADEYITKAAGPSWAEVASVSGLAARLYLGNGADALRRYFAWGQAIRCAVL